MGFPFISTARRRTCAMKTVGDSRTLGLSDFGGMQTIGGYRTNAMNVKITPGPSYGSIEDFEDATLISGLTVGPSWNLGHITLPSSGYHWEGTHCIEFDNKAQAFAEIDLGSALSVFRVAFAIRVGAQATQGYASYFLTLLDGLGAEVQNMNDGRSWGNVRNMAATNSSDTLTITDSTVYWISLVKSAGSLLIRVYNADHSLLGTITTTLATACRYIRVGCPKFDIDLGKTTSIDYLIWDTSTSTTDPILGWASTGTRTVTYNANGATHGSAPTDANTYSSGATVTAMTRPIHLVRSGYLFDGWNTAADGSGTSYAAGATFTISASMTLYAKWKVYAATSRIIRQGKHDPASLSNAQVTAAAGIKVFLQHASVGQDIVGNSDTDSTTGVDSNGSLPCGLALVYSGNNRYLLNRDSETSAVSPSWYGTHNGLQDDHIGNPGYAAKISEMQTSLTGLNGSATFAMMKFCFIDGPADPDAVFDALRSASANWTSATIVFWTMPIEISGHTDYNPTGRQAFNDMLRQWVVDNNRWLFDLADLESDGGTVLDGSNREVLAASYSLDGGHLSTAGKTKMAGAFWRLLSALAEG